MVKKFWWRKGWLVGHPKKGGFPKSAQMGKRTFHLLTRVFVLVGWECGIGKPKVTDLMMLASVFSRTRSPMSKDVSASHLT